MVVPLGLRLWPVAHGMPRGYVPDNHVVRCALGMARDRDLVPPVGKYSSYPYLVPYLLLPVYAAQYAAGRATGAWGGAQEFGQRAMHDPGMVQLPARVLVAVFGALTAAAVFGAARAAGLARGAWVAAWLMGTSLLDVQFSVHERPWAVVVLFGALCLWGAVAHARDGARRPLLLSAVAAGLAFAAHQAGLVFLGLTGLAWLLAPQPWRERSGLARRVALGAGCVALFALVGVLLGHPYYLVHGSVPDEAVAGAELGDVPVSIGGQGVSLGFSLRSLQRLSLAFFGYDPALLVLGLGGLPALLGRRVTRPAGLFLLAVALFFLTKPGEHVRYLLPVAMLLCLPAGLAGERLLRTRAGAVVLGVLLALPLAQSLRMGWVLRQEDTRAIAERRLAAELPPDARVAIDHYGPAAELSQGALETVGALRGSLRTREAWRLEALRQGWLPESEGGLDALPAEELFELGVDLVYGVRRTLRERAETPPELLGQLGVTHFLLVDRRPGGPPGPPLAGLARQGRLVFAVNPAPGPQPPGEAFLPTEMDFPLTALWQVDRPGPYLELWALPGR